MPIVARYSAVCAPGRCRYGDPVTHKAPSTVRAGTPNADDRVTWDQRLIGLRHAWQDVPAEPTDDQVVAAWQTRLTQMRATMLQMRRQHRWTRGPTDLLSICGVQRRETAHSAALAWLCDPEAGHGLKSTFLAALLALTGEPATMTEPVRVATEVMRDQSRADLVAQAPAWALVVETKIDADESPNQCQRLFEDWRDEPGLRMLLITPTGRPPRTTSTAPARDAWRSTSWQRVTGLLTHAIATAAPNVPGAVAASEYARTLQRLFGRRSR
jgi:hypothetical protein